MRIIYLKETIDDNPFVITRLYKIIEVNDEQTILFEIDSEGIKIEEYDEFFDTVNFIKKRSM